MTLTWNWQLKITGIWCSTLITAKKKVKYKNEGKTCKWSICIFLRKKDLLLNVVVRLLRILKTWEKNKWTANVCSQCNETAFFSCCWEYVKISFKRTWLGWRIDSRYVLFLDLKASGFWGARFRWPSPRHRPPLLMRKQPVVGSA